MSSTPSKPASFRSWKLGKGEPLLNPPSMNAFFQRVVGGSAPGASVVRLTSAAAATVAADVRRKVLRSIRFMVRSPKGGWVEGRGPGVARGHHPLSTYGGGGGRSRGSPRPRHVS